MEYGYHTFHIPVMGTGHSADTPIRVAPLGISSVISLVDDLLLEEIRGHYARLHGLEYAPIPRGTEDGRARRITAYLDTVGEIVRRRFADVQAMPWDADNAKAHYFRLLPDDAPLKQDYAAFVDLPPGPQRDAVGRELTARMRPGSIDVNIMVKVDRVNYDDQGRPLDAIHRDAMAALRGYANSQLSSAVVLSAGINQALYSYMAEFPDFYRDASGQPKKRIILKVSDFRSARIQTQYLARKGLEVWEYRVESGLNCGGHVFATDGHLLPGILREFVEHRDDLAEAVRSKVIAYYEEHGWRYPQAALESRPRLTVQGGIGTHGEVRRLHERFGADGTGWATPFLLVAEATCVDDATRAQLAQAGAGDVRVSDVSPLRIPFSNLVGSGSERHKRTRIAEGRPGSPCPKGYGATNTEFGERPLCIASGRYQRLKLAEIDGLDLAEEEKQRRRAAVMERSCICDHLGNGARIALGLAEADDAPQAVCPGSNLIWFDREYTLQEMVDHIYGRGPSLVPPHRPHMFAQELVLYVDHYEALCTSPELTSEQDTRYRAKFRQALEESIGALLEEGRSEPYGDENPSTIVTCVAAQRERLQRLDAMV